MAEDISPVSHLGVGPRRTRVSDPIGRDDGCGLALGLGPVHQSGHVVAGV